MSAEHTHGRTLTMYGTAKTRSRVLVAGCVNGTTCAGTDVVNADVMGCPPPDAELWYFATLDPNGADLDATPDHPGAQAFRQAVADLRPTVAIVFRTGTEPRVHAAGPSTKHGRRFARIARLPFTRDPERGPRGLGRDRAAPARPRSPSNCRPAGPQSAGRHGSRTRSTASPGPASPRAPTRSGRRMIAFGRDPRDSRH